MKTALAVTTQEGQVLGVVRNEEEHQDTINRSVTNIMRQHTKSDDVKYNPEQETYAIKTSKGITVIHVRETNIY